jgi:hypothetical protein
MSLLPGTASGAAYAPTEFLSDWTCFSDSWRFFFSYLCLFSPSPLLVACELETRFLDSPCVIPTELPFAGGYVKAPIATTKLTMFESYSPLKRSLSFLTIETHSRFDLHRTMPWHLNAMVIIPKQYFRWPLRLRGGVLALAVLI